MSLRIILWYVQPTRIIDRFYSRALLPVRKIIRARIGMVYSKIYLQKWWCNWKRRKAIRNEGNWYIQDLSETQLISSRNVPVKYFRKYTYIYIYLLYYVLYIFFLRLYSTWYIIFIEFLYHTTLIALFAKIANRESNYYSIRSSLLSKVKYLNDTYAYAHKYFCQYE